MRAVRAETLCDVASRRLCPRTSQARSTRDFTGSLRFQLSLSCRQDPSSPLRDGDVRDDLGELAGVGREIGERGSPRPP